MRPHRLRRLLPRFAAVIVASGVVLAVAAAAMAVPASLIGEAGSGDPRAIELGPLAQRSYVFAADGSLMATLKDEENRQPVPLTEVPQHVVAPSWRSRTRASAIHEGFDVRGISGRSRPTSTSGGISQGGSTITQQLVKLDQLSPEQTLDRKVQELVLASRLEKEMTKEEILDRYLNTVYFGNHATGSRRRPRPTAGSASSSSTWARRHCWPASSATPSPTTRCATRTGPRPAATSPSTAWSRSGR